MILADSSTNQTQPIYPGTCMFCGALHATDEMAEHLSRCPERDQAMENIAKRQTTKTHPTFRLLVEGYDAPQYWMYVEIARAASLATLDGFLSRTWLECCGHASAFYIDEKQYGGFDMPEMPSYSIGTKLRDVLKVGDWFGYEYDFGSTTTLRLGIVAEDEGLVGPTTVILEARNIAPVFRCAECGKPATQVCCECKWDDDEGGWRCDACAAEHECGEEMFLPVMNSPRVGVCAYGRTWDDEV